MYISVDLYIYINIYIYTRALKVALTLIGGYLAILVNDGIKTHHNNKG